MQRVTEPPLEARAAAEATVAGLAALAPPVVVQVQPRPAAPAHPPAVFWVVKTAGHVIPRQEDSVGFGTVHSSSLTE